MILSVAVAVVDLVFPYVSRWSMNVLLPENLFKAFFVVMGIIFAAYLLRAFFMYLIMVVGHQMGTLVEADMREDIFGHMQHLSFSFYDKNRTGILLGRITNDLFEIVELAHHGPENILTCSITIIGAIVILMTINVPLAVLLLVLAILCVVVSGRFRLEMTVRNKKVKARTGEINAAIESGISGIRVAKAFANEDIEIAKFRESNDRFKHSKIGYYKAMGYFNSSVEATVGIMQVAVIAVGGYLTMRNNINYVDLITFTLYVSTFTTPVRKLAQFMEIFSQGTAGYERFLEVMRTESDIKDAEDATELADVNGEVSFENVTFAYSNGREVLHDVSFKVEPGKTFALVGPSGGGKTTICHLIPRFYDVSAGKVMVDGTDIRDVTQKSLRNAVGIIQQDVFLFAGTVMDNIRYGRPDATDEEVIEAAKLSEIHEDIMAMPDGYDTYVGERGVILSGGQKQRISIARVFLKNPKILILDEATSALDSVTESRIQESFDRLSVGRTCIVIAHRLSTVRNADCIAVVENGSILEQGTRDELLAAGGHYAALESAQCK
ncbi:MAG: ABC transporter ATP-binding protein [Clostridiales bacterium]|nr:ABC transporter ATP-binding protein [Candidatus Crickella equi]